MMVTRSVPMSRGSKPLRSLKPCPGARSTRVYARYTSAPEPCIVMSNDDGVDSELALRTAQSLRDKFGMRVLFVAPSTNNSAASNRITLRKEMPLVNRADLGPDTFSLAGTPADCMMITLDKGIGLCTALNLAPVAMVSGPNYGSNLSIDCLYSGTFAAARTAALLGVPAVASSSSSTEYSDDHTTTVKATLRVVEVALKALHGKPASNYPRSYFPIPYRGRRFVPGQSRYQPHDKALEDPEEVRALLRAAFVEGDLVLNVNAPTRTWSGKFRTTGLSLMFYRDVMKTMDGVGVPAVVREAELSREGDEGDVFGRPFPLVGASTDFGDMDVRVPAGYINAFGRTMAEDVTGSDLEAIMSNVASITPLQTWPEGHPLGLSDQVMAHAIESDAEGFPLWLTERAGSNN